MSINYNKMVAEMRKVLEIDRLEKEVADLRKQNEKISVDLKEMNKEYRALCRKLDSFESNSQKTKTPALIEIIEEKMSEFDETVKVVDLREKLQDDERVKSRAENFYAVIATAMNNSRQFEKIGAGEYKYLGGKSLD